MKIEKFRFRKKHITVEELEFSNTDLVLLLGLSGSGKSLILESLKYLRHIAWRRNIDEEMEWDVTFVENDDRFRWKGSVCSQSLEESLSKNGGWVFEHQEGKYRQKDFRDGEVCSIQKEPISILRLMSNQGDILLAQTALGRIYSWTEMLSGVRETPKFEYENLLDVKNSFDSRIPYGEKAFDNLCLAQIPIYAKLALLQEHFPDRFSVFKQDILSSFPHIDDFRAFSARLSPLLSLLDLDSKDLSPRCFKLVPELSLKVDEQWIGCPGGMLKIILLMGALYFIPEESILLIDEVENSLDVECLREICDRIKSSRNIQIFLSSHHPCVINNIPVHSWRILKRKS